MQNTVLSSTLFLTLLMLVGLVFFIRAATKDRTETLRLQVLQEETAVLKQLVEYFASRAYRPLTANDEAPSSQDQDASDAITLAGFVRPSPFLAIFLTLLAAVGLVCLALVMMIVFPSYGGVFWGMPLLSLLAGGFYWKKAARQEVVHLQVVAETPSAQVPQSLLTIVAHRDELIQLQRNLLQKMPTAEVKKVEPV